MDPISILYLNCALYVILLVFNIVNKRGILGILLTSIYAAIAIGCAFFYSQGEYIIRDLLLWPFLFYFVVYIILLKPFQQKNIIISKIDIPNAKAMNWFFDGYLIASVIYVYIYYGNVIEALRSGSWLSVYINMRAEDTVFYNSLYEQVLINLTTYLRIPAIFYAFYVYAKNIPYGRKALLLIVPFINSAVWAVFTASRTEFVVIGFLYIACFLILSETFSPSFKKKILVGLSAFGAAAAVFIIAVSASRFGEGENSWLKDYFGDSFIVAHNTIGYTDRLGYGSHFFKQINQLLGIHIPPYHCQIDDGTAFHSLIGMRYSDFGLIGTYVYAFIGCLWMNLLLNKKRLLLGDVYLLLYYFIVLFIGVFYDSATAYSWLIVIVISFILNKISLRNVKS